MKNKSKMVRDLVSLKRLRKKTLKKTKKEIVALKEELDKPFLKQDASFLSIKVEKNISNLWLEAERVSKELKQDLLKSKRIIWLWGQDSKKFVDIQRYIKKYKKRGAKKKKQRKQRKQRKK